MKARKLLYTHVTLYDDNTATMLANFYAYPVGNGGYISMTAGINLSSQVCPEWRFHEWLSFAIRCGHIVCISVVTQGDNINDIRSSRTEFQVPIFQGI